MPLDSTSWNDKPEPDGLRRLRRLETVIEGVPDRLFDMETWRDDEAACGAVGCALGWAAFAPDFQAEGLRLEVDPEFSGAYPVYGGRDGFGAGEAFFGLSVDEANNLFDHLTYTTWMGRSATKAEFLRRLRDIIADKAAAHTAAQEATHA